LFLRLILLLIVILNNVCCLVLNLIWLCYVCDYLFTNILILHQWLILLKLLRLVWGIVLDLILLQRLILSVIYLLWLGNILIWWKVVLRNVLCLILLIIQLRLILTIRRIISKLYPSIYLKRARKNSSANTNYKQIHSF
jgi:hypothetical protein